jgi:lipopolysaccharide biosynthesis regulator YciM
MQYIFYLILLAVLIILFLTLNRTSKKPSDHQLFSNALNALVNNEKKKAYKILKQIISKDSSHHEAFLLLGNLYREKNIENAIKIHKSLIIRPNLTNDFKFHVHKSLVLDYLECENIEKAKNELINCLLIRPNLTNDFKFHVHKSLVLDYLECENIEKAKNELINCLLIRPKEYWALDLLKNISSEQKDWESALIYEEKILKFYPEKKETDASMLNYFIAKDFQKKNNFKKYIFHLNKSISYVNVFPKAYKDLCLLEENSLDEIIKYFVKYVNLQRINFVEDCKLIEQRLFDMNAYHQIENLYKQILDLNFNSFAFNRLIDIFLEKNEKDKAAELIESVFHEMPNPIIKLNQIKLKVDDPEIRKSLSVLCNELTIDEK